MVAGLDERHRRRAGRDADDWRGRRRFARVAIDGLLAGARAASTGSAPSRTRISGIEADDFTLDGFDVAPGQQAASRW